MLVKASWLCLLIAVGLFIWASLRMFADESSPTEGGLIVEEMERDLGEQTVGIHAIEIRVRNSANRPRCIMGMPDT